jgi:hypothetical protein
MNNSTYCSYGEQILYKFDNVKYQIPAQIYPHIEIQQLDTITWAPHQAKEKVDMNTYSIFNNNLSFLELINKARLGIHNPNNLVIQSDSVKDTKASRLGTTSSTSSPNNRRLVFTRGINVPITVPATSATPTPTPSNTVGATTTPSNTVGLTATPTLTTTPSSTPPIAGSTLNNFNSIWNSISFTGSGSLANPYANSSNSSINSAGIQFTTVLSGTLRITCSSMYSDYGIDIYKNGTLQSSPPTIPDSSGGYGADYNVNITMSVNANDVIAIGTTSDYYTWSTPINIWVQ